MTLTAHGAFSNPTPPAQKPPNQAASQLSIFSEGVDGKRALLLTALRIPSYFAFASKASGCSLTNFIILSKANWALPEAKA